MWKESVIPFRIGVSLSVLAKSNVLKIHHGCKQGRRPIYNLFLYSPTLFFVCVLLCSASCFCYTSNLSISDLSNTILFLFFIFIFTILFQVLSSVNLAFILFYIRHHTLKVFFSEPKFIYFIFKFYQNYGMTKFVSSNYYYF